MDYFEESQKDILNFKNNNIFLSFISSILMHVILTTPFLNIFSFIFLGMLFLVVISTLFTKELSFKNSKNKTILEQTNSDNQHYKYYYDKHATSNNILKIFNKIDKYILWLYILSFVICLIAFIIIKN